MRAKKLSQAGVIFVALTTAFACFFVIGANSDEKPQIAPKVGVKSSKSNLIVGDVSQYSAVIVIANNSGETIQSLQLDTKKNNTRGYYAEGSLKDGEQRILVAYNMAPGLVRFQWSFDNKWRGGVYRTQVKAGVPLTLIINANNKVTATNFNTRIKTAQQ